MESKEIKGELLEFSKMKLKRGTKILEVLPWLVNFCLEEDIDVLKKLSFGSDKKVSFVCQDGHEFTMSPSSFRNGGRWCPSCGSNAITRDLSFGIKVPHRVKNWSPRNSFSPYEVYPRSDKKAWFVCDCGYEFDAMIKGVTRGGWCPSCAGRPRITEQWIDEKIKYREITRKSGYVNARTNMDWECGVCKHKWKATWDNINSSYSGCPNCSSSRGEKRVYSYLSSQGHNFKKEVSFDDLRDNPTKKLRYDFGIYDNASNLLCLIEYDGIQHTIQQPLQTNEMFASYQRRDRIKDEYAKSNDIPLLRIPYTEFDSIEDILDEFLSQDKLIPSQAR